MPVKIKLTPCESSLGRHRTRHKMFKLICYLAIYAVISALGLALLKMALSANADGNAGVLGLLRNWRFIVGFFLYGTGFVMWMFLLQRHDLTLVFPMAAGSLFVAVGILGIFLLHEPLNIGRVAGMAIILVGVSLLAWNS